uniref:Uncharacterized protein n=1 Tax=Rhizophagus irregularis (strain DAOM 181602 / DAOM 197198 / MUCL 43194) TaxID=747089 RepID=U9TVP8_RHIID
MFMKLKKILIKKQRIKKFACIPVNRICLKNYERVIIVRLIIDFYGQLFFINAPLGFAFKYIVYIAYCRTISQNVWSVILERCFRGVVVPVVKMVLQIIFRNKVLKLIKSRNDLSRKKEILYEYEVKLVLTVSFGLSVHKKFHGT